MGRRFACGSLGQLKLVPVGPPARPSCLRCDRKIIRTSEPDQAYMS